MKQLSLLMAFILLTLSSCQMGKSIGACPSFEGMQESAAMLGGQQNKAKKKNTKARKKLEKKKNKLEEKLNLLLGNFDLETIVGQLNEEKNLDLETIVGQLHKRDNLDLETIVNQLHQENNLDNWILPDSTCPIIILKDQSTIYAEIKKMENDTLFLESCDSTENAFTLPNNTVQSIEYDPEQYELNKDKQFNLRDGESNVGYYDYGEGNDYQYEDMKNAKNLATWSLVCGLLGLVGLIFGGLGILLAIPSIILANKSLNLYNQYPGYREGRSMATAGKVIGICLAILLALVILVLILLVGTLQQ